LKAYIKWEIEKQKYETELIKAVEEFINEIRWKNMTITIPQTLIQEEFKSRIKSLEDRLGWENGVKQYFQQLWDEKSRQFVEDISKAAQDSLEKFFILQQIAKDLELDIDWNKWEHLDVEKKLYEKVMWL
jgi:FKBP-type peptidyl-prolyl cis-trans isomerase (trigger factor)